MPCQRDLLVKPLLSALPRPLHYSVLPNLAYRLETSYQRRQRDIGRSQLSGVGEDADVRRISGHRNFSKELLTSRVFSGVACRLEIVMVREQEAVLSVRSDRVPNEQIPHEVRGLLLRDVVGHRWCERGDPSDAHH
ncbi:MAG: hypothetical protein MP439_10070 [Ferrimicrobium sp.]|nr:hypothetical protein [Ferrimicrobium sp.]